MQSDGSARTELPWLLPGDGDPVVSPDGRRLAFSSSRDGNREIYVADATTGEVRRVTASRRLVDQKPAWSPDGRRIAWQAGARGRPADVFVMRADGGKKRRLAGGPGDDIDPAWSPDGTRIAFASNRNGGFDLWSVTRAGGEPELLLDAPGAARAPAWSPDGAKVAYSGASEGATSIWVLRIGTPEPVRLTRSRGGGPAPGLVARRAAPALHPLRSRPLEHLGHPGARRHCPARQGQRGRQRPGLGDRGAGARARSAGALTRPRPAAADRPRRDRQGGRVLPRIHVCGGQPRSGSAAHQRLAAARVGQHARRPGDRAPPRRNAHRARRGHAALPAASAPPALAFPGVRELRAPPRGRPRDRRARPQERLLPDRPLRPLVGARPTFRAAALPRQLRRRASRTAVGYSRGPRPATWTAIPRSSTARTWTSRRSRRGLCARPSHQSDPHGARGALSNNTASVRIRLSWPAGRDALPRACCVAARRASTATHSLRAVERRARLIGVNHVALEVADLDAALELYGRMFSFELRGRVPARRSSTWATSSSR